MTTYSLFLDDEREPADSSTDNWVICRTFEEAVEMFKSCIPDKISFDHDLGTEKSGYDFAKWIVEYDMDHKVLNSTFSFYVHSQNPVGKNNIEQLLFGYFGATGKYYL